MCHQSLVIYCMFFLETREICSSPITLQIDFEEIHYEKFKYLQR